MPGLAAQRPLRTTPVHDDALMHLAVLPYVGTHVDTGFGVGFGVYGNKKTNKQHKKSTIFKKCF